MERDLFGPERSNVEPVEDVADLDVWAEQFCNRWVYLKHQRPAALKDLRELIAEARKAVS